MFIFTILMHRDKILYRSNKKVRLKRYAIDNLEGTVIFATRNMGNKKRKKKKKKLRRHGIHKYIDQWNRSKRGRSYGIIEYTYVYKIIQKY